MDNFSFRIKAYIENGWVDRVINPDLPILSWEQQMMVRQQMILSRLINLQSIFFNVATYKVCQ